MSRNPNTARPPSLALRAARPLAAERPAVTLGVSLNTQRPPNDAVPVVPPSQPADRVEPTGWAEAGPNPLYNPLYAAVSRQLAQPGFVRDTLAPAVWDMFQHLHDAPVERRKRLTLALLSVIEKGDDYLAAHYGKPGNLLKFALDNPITDAAEMRLADEAAGLIEANVQAVFEVLKPIYDRLFGGARDS